MSNRVLVIDPNRVYAKVVQGILETNVVNCKADVASNIWEVKRRLASQKYNVVLADFSVSMDADEMLEELSDIDVTIIQWSAVKMSSASQLSEYQLQKPEHPKDIHEILGSLECLPLKHVDKKT